MSRIGKKIIKIPGGVTVKQNGRSILASGPKGQLDKVFPEGAEFAINADSVTVSDKSGQNSMIWGLSRALLSNMLKGVSEGFEEVLEFNGVGFKAQVKGDTLELNLGFSHPIDVKAPAGILFETDKGIIKIKGIDNQKVGQIAAQIRAIRPPEPYKGSGIKYRSEVVRRKAGKKAATTGA